MSFAERALGVSSKRESHMPEVSQNSCRTCQQPAKAIPAIVHISVPSVNS